MVNPLVIDALNHPRQLTYMPWSILNTRDLDPITVTNNHFGATVQGEDELPAGLYNDDEGNAHLYYFASGDDDCVRWGHTVTAMQEQARIIGNHHGPPNHKVLFGFINLACHMLDVWGWEAIPPDMCVLIRDIEVLFDNTPIQNLEGIGIGN
jgi:hypothetical protein